MRAHAIRVALALGAVSVLAPPLAHAQERAVWATRLDYTRPANRHAPIVCKDGDLERHAGKSLAQLFDGRWPEQAEPAPGADTQPARMVRSVRPRGAMRGMPVQPGVVVFATLVDAAGQPVAVEVLCASTEGYDKFAKRIAQQSDYAAAVVNGTPVTSVVVHAQKFSGGGN